MLALTPLLTLLTTAPANLPPGDFAWTISEPLIAPADRPDDPCYSVKDPSVVYANGRWHLFVTIRSQVRSHAIEYLTFTDWSEASRAEHVILPNHPGYFCAPQVFWFEPHQLWYLICQASSDDWEPKYGAAYATNPDIGKPHGWSPLKPLGHQFAEGKAGLDFWVICDDAKAHLFFTTNNGKMWHESTALANFPTGWSPADLAIQGDIFEASHTYRVQGGGQYLTIIEAQGGHGWRYYKAYLADTLDGPWRPLAATKEETFASLLNTTPVGPRWTESISHAELLRAGFDQRLELAPDHLRMVFQGVLNKDRAGKKYGEIPWRLGLLEQVSAAAD